MRERAASALLLNQLRDQPSPAGLMRGPESAAGIAVEIFMEQMPLAIAQGIEAAAGSARERPFAVGISRPEVDQPVRQVVRDLVQRHELAGSGGAFHFEIVAVVVMKLLQRFDKQIINRKPYRPAPIRVPAEHVGLGLCWLVHHHFFLIADAQNVWVCFVELAHGAHAERAEKFFGIEQTLSANASSDVRA